MDSALLNNILGLLVVGVLFYFVIHKVRKGGCCNHAHDQCNRQVQNNNRESDANNKV